MQRIFTVDEARELMPELREMLSDANKDLEVLASDLRDANERYSNAEESMDDDGKSARSSSAAADDVESLRARRAEFQSSIEELSRTQKKYLICLNEWVERITGKGVLLRDLHEGLLDFPASQNGFDYFLCWKVDETDIEHWHSSGEGFTSRKPLFALDEYC